MSYYLLLVDTGCYRLLLVDTEITRQVIVRDKILFYEYFQYSYLIQQSVSLPRAGTQQQKEKGYNKINNNNQYNAKHEQRQVT